MQEVGEPVDDRDRGMLRQLHHVLMRKRPDHDAIHHAGEYPGGVGDRFSPTELDVPRRQEQRVPAELIGPHLERHAGASAALREDHAQRLSRERSVEVHARFQVRRQREQLEDLFP